MEKKGVNIKGLLIISIATLLFYSVFKNAIAVSDDFIYSLPTSDGIGGVLSFFVDHYMTWSGRFAHLLDMMMLMIGFDLWKFITPFLLASLPFLAFFLAKLKMPRENSDFIPIFVIYGLMTTFSDLYTVQMLYWHTACITYLYFPYFLMIFLIPFRKQFKHDETIEKDGFIKIIGFGFMAFILGFSQEVVGAITFAFVACVVGYKWYHKKNIYKYEVASLIFSLLGFMILILAPGNECRKIFYSEWVNGGWTYQFKQGIGYFIMNQYNVQAIIISVFASLLFYQTYKMNKKVSAYFITIFALPVVLMGLMYMESSISWEILKLWKYSLEYAHYPIRDILFPILFYGWMSLQLLGMSLYISYQKKDMFLFVILSAIICSNLTTLLSPVGTSYISFPGIMLMFSTLVYLFPKMNMKVAYTIAGISMLLFCQYISEESYKMFIVQSENEERMEIIQHAVTTKADKIILKPFTYRVWGEADLAYENNISNAFKVYYNIPSETELVMEE